MDSEPCGGGHRVYEASKWCCAQAVEVVSLCKVAGRNRCRGKSGDVPEQVDCVQAGRVDEPGAIDPRRFMAGAQLRTHLARRALGRNQLGIEHHQSARALEIAVQCGHELMHIDDARARAQQPCRTADVRLEVAYLALIKRLEVHDSIGDRALTELL